MSFKFISSRRRSYRPFKGRKSKSRPSDVNKEFDSMVSAISKISGPIGISLLKPTAILNHYLERDGPILIMIHDYHYGRIGCEPCNSLANCVSMLQSKESELIPFFKITRNVAIEKIAVDVFLETWNEDTSASLVKSALNDIILDAKQCLDIHHQCKYSPLRFHMSDPRNKVDDADAIFKVIKKMTYYDFDLFVSKKFPVVSTATIIDLLDSRLRLGAKLFFQNFFRYHDFFRAYSATYKQLGQIPKACRQKIYEHYHDYLGLIRSNNIQTENKQSNTLDALIADTFPKSDETDNSIKTIQQVYVSLQMAINKSKVPITWVGATASLDIYFLCRCLKTPDKGEPSQISILYAGDKHCLHLLHFLTNTTNYYELIKFGFQLQEIPYIKCVELKDIETVIDQICSSFYQTFKSMINCPTEEVKELFFAQLTQMRHLMPIFHKQIERWINTSPALLAPYFAQILQVDQ